MWWENPRALGFGHNWRLAEGAMGEEGGGSGRPELRQECSSNEGDCIPRLRCLSAYCMAIYR